MNEGNCPGCKEALHTKVRVTAHPILGYEKNGDPIRGLEEDFLACGDCVGKGEDIGAAVGEMRGVKPLQGKPAAPRS